MLIAYFALFSLIVYLPKEWQPITAPTRNFCEKQKLQV